jgi:hypothetical protein
VSYAYLVHPYLNLNRLEEARAVAEEAQAKKLDSPLLHGTLYRLAFLKNDAAGMVQQVAWSAGKPGVEDLLLAYEADTAMREALFGNATEARQRAATALALSTGRDVQYGAGLALALAGDASRAQALADDMGKQFPEDAVVQFN